MNAIRRSYPLILMRLHEYNRLGPAPIPELHGDVMHFGSSPASLAATGKTISSAKIVSEARDKHGTFLVFTDGTQLGMTSYSQNAEADVRH